MSDLGDIIIKERPLIIREAIVGGRKLTKALFMQLPELTHVLVETNISIVAWVNHHWKRCDWGLANWLDASYDHRHAICSDNGSPKRGIVAKPVSDTSPIEIWHTISPGGDELAAIFARWVLNGKPASQHSRYYHDITHRGRKLRFHWDSKLSNILKPSYGQDGPSKALVATARPELEGDELLIGIDQGVQAALEWRAKLEELWLLVTEETPQVFI
jgi:hypothetical protein